MAGSIKMPLAREVGLSTSNIVLDGTQLPPQKGAEPPPKFSAHVYCGQTAGWMKMPLSTEVDLSSGHIVLVGDPVPPTKGAQQPPPPLFGPCLLWPDGWMDQDVTWHGGRSRLRPHCARWGPSFPSLKSGRSPPPNFRPMSIVAKRLNG